VATINIMLLLIIVFSILTSVSTIPNNLINQIPDYIVKQVSNNLVTDKIPSRKKFVSSRVLDFFAPKPSSDAQLTTVRTIVNFFSIVKHKKKE